MSEIFPRVERLLPSGGRDHNQLQSSQSCDLAYQPIDLSAPSRALSRISVTLSNIILRKRWYFRFDAMCHVFMDKNCIASIHPILRILTGTTLPSVRPSVRPSVCGLSGWVVADFCSAAGWGDRALHLANHVGEDSVRLWQKGIIWS